MFKGQSTKHTMTKAKPTPRTTRYTAAALIAALLLTAFDSHAFLGIGGGEKARKLKEADAAYTAGAAFYNDKNAADAFNSFATARTGYAELLQNYPTYNKEHVLGRYNSSGSYMESILLRVQAGQLTLDMPDEKPAPAAKPAAAPANAKPANNPKTQPAKPVPPPPAATVLMPVAPAVPAAPAAKLPSDDAARTRHIENLIEQENATDAVFAAEDFIANDGGKNRTSDTTRLLLVRALIEVRNYNRANAELREIMDGAEKITPFMRSLASTLAFQKGDYMSAALEMDKLLEECPGYADARVNAAYCYYLLDMPELAARSYRVGVNTGAKRSLLFEEAVEMAE